ncbi:MAG: chemotaxis protein CheV [Candidatus Omnitrophica bacterium]|nr:chemotaxis protein CheV [Candidatus Omnitrophota bacterium]MCB9748135.1 chemotaxis protein CheV [Candidatus Omnitrophota bacterium]
MPVDDMPTKIIEAGSNELEIVEFCVNKEYYGINVSKVREIIRVSDGIVPVPESHEAISGVINLRGNIIPVVNLAKHLKINTEYDPQKSRIVVSEFNKIQVGFWVSHVTRIHRFSWKDVETPSGLVQSKSKYAIGIIKMDQKIIFLLDFEKISSDINPETGLQESGHYNFSSENVNFDRGTKNILIVEDSAFIQGLLKENTEQAGYKSCVVSNGQEAWNLLEKTVKENPGKDISEFFNLVITDIEMPQMDGLSLIKNIKDNPVLTKLPCIVFSSIISKEMAMKCQKVGAADQITKPEIVYLVEKVDKLVI